MISYNMVQRGLRINAIELGYANHLVEGGGVCVELFSQISEDQLLWEQQYWLQGIDIGQVGAAEHVLVRLLAELPHSVCPAFHCWRGAHADSPKFRY